MSIKSRKLTVSGIEVDVIHKDIKNLHLGVYPPFGRVRVAAPVMVSEDAVRLAVIDKLGWIKRQKAKYEAQAREAKREMLSGESHYFLGQRYLLNVLEYDGPHDVTIRNKSTLDLRVRPNTPPDARLNALQDWYRGQLRELVPPLLEKWKERLNTQVNDWGVRKMKTKWGSCNPAERRIWINLELAKKPLHCIEYVIVHELAHLRESNHGAGFATLMDKVLPKWRTSKDELNHGLLGHDEWQVPNET
jgi:predicted metal-dependent hydrolase